LHDLVFFAVAAHRIAEDQAFGHTITAVGANRCGERTLTLWTTVRPYDLEWATGKCATGR
jgi:hypothetical protein